ncbi:unnamed protein product [Lampetra planeri]
MAAQSFQELPVGAGTAKKKINGGRGAFTAEKKQQLRSPRMGNISSRFFLRRQVMSAKPERLLDIGAKRRDIAPNDTAGHVGGGGVVGGDRPLARLWEPAGRSGGGPRRRRERRGHRCVSAVSSADALGAASGWRGVATRGGARWQRATAVQALE